MDADCKHGIAHTVVPRANHNDVTHGSHLSGLFKQTTQHLADAMHDCLS